MKRASTVQYWDRHHRIDHPTGGMERTKREEARTTNHNLNVSQLNPMANLDSQTKCSALKIPNSNAQGRYKASSSSHHRRQGGCREGERIESRHLSPFTTRWKGAPPVLDKAAILEHTRRTTARYLRRIVRFPHAIPGMGICEEERCGGRTEGKRGKVRESSMANKSNN